MRKFKKINIVLAFFFIPPIVSMEQQGPFDALMQGIISAALPTTATIGTSMLLNNLTGSFNNTNNTSKSKPLSMAKELIAQNIVPVTVGTGMYVLLNYYLQDHLGKSPDDSSNATLMSLIAKNVIKPILPYVVPMTTTAVTALLCHWLQCRTIKEQFRNGTTHSPFDAVLPTYNQERKNFKKLFIENNTIVTETFQELFTLTQSKQTDTVKTKRAVTDTINEMKNLLKMVDNIFDDNDALDNNEQQANNEALSVLTTSLNKLEIDVMSMQDALNTRSQNQQQYTNQLQGLQNAKNSLLQQIQKKLQKSRSHTSNTPPTIDVVTQLLQQNLTAPGTNHSTTRYIKPL